MREAYTSPTNPPTERGLPSVERMISYTPVLHATERCEGNLALFETAREILRYAREELRKALRTGDQLLYRNAADKAFLALIVAINEYIRIKEGITPTSHSERGRILRKMGREDLRALYSDIMKTLHEEAFYEGVYQPEEVEYAVKKVEEIINMLEKEAKNITMKNQADHEPRT
jgi:hypothetical protein